MSGSDVLLYFLYFTVDERAFIVCGCALRGDGMTSGTPQATVVSDPRTHFGGRQIKLHEK